MDDPFGLPRVALGLAVLLTMSGCVVQRDYGRGKCMEYTGLFFCWQGSMNCRTDDKGCRSCECVGAGDLRH
jgi:hypothetical protein